MKCDHLLGRMFDGEVYILASDVMEAVAEMKDKLRDHCIHCPVKMQEDDVVAYLKAKLEKTIAERDGNQVCIDALKAKLENVQASMYADVVDANMEIVKLKKEILRQKRLRCYNLKMWCSAERFTHHALTIPDEGRWWERHFNSVCRIWERFKEAR